MLIVGERYIVAPPGGSRLPQRAEARRTMLRITAEALGDAQFRADYGIKYACLAGSMYKGISSEAFVVALGNDGCMGFLGTGGLSLSEIESSIRAIQNDLGSRPYGVNLLSNGNPATEERMVDLFLSCGVRYVEAASFARITPALVRFRLSGVKQGAGGAIEAPHRILAKVARPEVASAFMQPAPSAIVDRLVQSGQLTPSEAELGRLIPMAHDICVEADSGGHTERGVAYTLMPVILTLRDAMTAKHRYHSRIRVGAAGGIGTPHAAAAAFIMGADFIMTGSINQCTREAGTSESAKDILERLDACDTAYAPAGGLFEDGGRMQVAARELCFPGRANELYELYQRYGSLQEIDSKTSARIQDGYFMRSFEDVWLETRDYYSRAHPHRLRTIDADPRQKMAVVFKWYFVHSARWAIEGHEVQRVNYQIHCGPALGAFNQWVRGTELQSWRNRRVADVTQHLMHSAAALLSNRVSSYASS